MPAVLHEVKRRGKCMDRDESDCNENSGKSRSNREGTGNNRQPVTSSELGYRNRDARQESDEARNEGSIQQDRTPDSNAGVWSCGQRVEQQRRNQKQDRTDTETEHASNPLDRT